MKGKVYLMRKLCNFAKKPLLFAITASVLLLPVAGCNSSGTNPDTPADKNQPGITDTADKPTVAPDATIAPGSKARVMRMPSSGETSRVSSRLS